MQNDKTFKIEPLYNVGDKVTIKATNKTEKVISVSCENLATIDDENDRYEWVYYTREGIFFASELQAVESFADFAARTQTADEPKTVTYTAKEKEEMLWDAENAEHQKDIDEQNEYHR